MNNDNPWISISLNDMTIYTRYVCQLALVDGVCYFHIDDSNVLNFDLSVAINCLAW